MNSDMDSYAGYEPNAAARQAELAETSIMLEQQEVLKEQEVCLEEVITGLRQRRSHHRGLEWQ